MNPITNDLKDTHDFIHSFDKFEFDYRNDNGIQKVAVWGNTATDTKNAVEEFIKNKEKGLEYFLQTVWC